MRRFLLFLLLLGPLSQLLAIEAAFQHAQYYLPDPIFKGKINPYLEIYWQINPKKIRYNTNKDKKIVARIKTHVTIINDTGHVLKNDLYIYETLPASTVDELAYLNILELKRYFLSPGKYRVTVDLTDLNDTSNVASYSDTFTTSALVAGAFYGDVELMDTFYASQIKTPFLKHGKQFIPLCDNFFDTYRNKLNYYTELYQLGKVSPQDFPLIQSVHLSRKPGGDPMMKYQKLDTINTKDVPFIAGTFDITDLPSGNYYLTFSLGTKQHATLTTKQLFIQRTNKRPAKPEVEEKRAEILDTGMENINVLDLNKTFLKKYDAAQVKAILKMLLPVSTPSEAISINGFLKKPEELYMRYFIYNHFSAIDKENPERAWKAFSDKVREANKLYTNHGKVGYETERGFMYLRYGQPSEVITVLNEKGALPYEIWQYNTLQDMAGHSEANAIILFYKASETDFDYKMLHTTVAGEPHNAGWRSFLYNTTDGGNQMTSRAEQCLGNR